MTDKPAPVMRNLLLATSTVALVLMFSSEAYPGSQIQPDSKTAPQVAESELNSPGTVPSASTVAQETEPPTPIQSAEDAAVGEQLRDLLENKLQKYEWISVLHDLTVKQTDEVTFCRSMAGLCRCCPIKRPRHSSGGRNEGGFRTPCVPSLVFPKMNAS
jgi:hypothetical protein